MIASLLTAAPASELDPNVIIPAGLTLVGVIAAAAIAARASRARSAPPAEKPSPDVAPSPLAAFSGTQNEFMALVMKDNAEIRARLVTVEGQVTELQSALADEKSRTTRMIAAFRRYLVQLTEAFGALPPPATDDIDVLEPTLPRRPRRKPA